MAMTTKIDEAVGYHVASTLVLYWRQQEGAMFDRNVRSMLDQYV
jgi:hypothetical protein